MDLKYAAGCDEKPENETLEAFVEVLLDNDRSDMSALLVQCPDADSSSEAADYFLPQVSTAIEVSELHDHDLTAETGAFLARKGRLKDALLAGNDPALSGQWFIGLRKGFDIPRGCEAEIASRLISAMTEPKVRFDDPQLGSVELDQISADGRAVAFSFVHEMRWIDRTQIAHDSFARKIAKASRQLQAIAGAERRILLLVDRGAVDSGWMSALFSALVRLRGNLKAASGIDEIWFQPRNLDEHKHTLVFTREFLTGFEAGSACECDRCVGLLTGWAPALARDGDDEKRELLLSAVRRVISGTTPHDELPDSDAREAIIFYLGGWLAEQGRMDDLLWLVEQFAGDPHPRADDLGGHTFEAVKQRFESDGLAPVIATVRGRTAWVLRHVAGKPETVLRSMESIRPLLSDENLLVATLAFPSLVTAIRCLLHCDLDEDAADALRSAIVAAIADVQRRAASSETSKVIATGCDEILKQRGDAA